MGAGLRAGSRVHRPSDVDEIVGDHTEADPAPHSIVALVSTAIEAVSPLDHADTSFAASAPFLTVAEPAFLLLALTLGASARAVGNAHAFDSHCFRSGLILDGVEPGVSRHQSRHTPQLGLVGCDGRDQQIAIVRPPSVDFIVDNDLVFGFLQLDHLAELVGLAGLALADDFGRWLEHAQNLAASYTAATISSSASTRSAWCIHSWRRSLT